MKISLGAMIAHIPFAYGTKYPDLSSQCSNFYLGLYTVSSRFKMLHQLLPSAPARGPSFVLKQSTSNKTQEIQTSNRYILQYLYDTFYDLFIEWIIFLCLHDKYCKSIRWFSLILSNMQRLRPLYIRCKTNPASTSCCPPSKPGNMSFSRAAIF